MRERCPPFVNINGRVYVVANWDVDTEDAGDTLLLVRLTANEEKAYREAVGNIEAELFATVTFMRKAGLRR